MDKRKLDSKTISQLEGRNNDVSEEAEEFGEEHAKDAGDETFDDGFGAEDADDVAFTGANGAEDTDFFSTLEDGDVFEL